MLGGKCHTLNRYECNVDSHGFSNYEKRLEDFQNAHRFHKAVDCARDVLSGQFINMSLLSLLALSFLF